MSRLYYSPYRHFRVVILLHRIRNRMNELFVRIKKVRGKAKVIHYSLKYRKLQSQQVWCHNHNTPTTLTTFRSYSLDISSCLLSSARQMLPKWKLKFPKCGMGIPKTAPATLWRGPTRQTPAEHADWTEFHCSRKFITAARAGALVPRAHGLKACSAAT
jgi:hypothetical protein